MDSTAEWASTRWRTAASTFVNSPAWIHERFKMLAPPRLPDDQALVGASIDLRWVDDLRWHDGLFAGAVESYTTVDATALYPVTDDVSVGLNITNLFDNRHWESFGGSILRRRALLSLQYGW